MVKRQVLLVGDDSQVSAVCREFLRRDSRYNIESIDYCDDALTALRHRRFDAVLILSLNARWRMWSSLSSGARRVEASSAILFLKQIRALPDPPPVIVVSGRQDAEAAALASGAVAFIRKPIILAELEEALHRVSPSSHAGG